MEPIIDIGTIEVERAQLELWRDGTLGEEWRRRFEAELPLYFDAAFREYYENQGKRHPPKFKGGYGFFETLGAIVLYHATGYLPITPTHNFQFPSQQEEIIEKLLPADVVAVIMDQTELGATQAPDLLMYAPDLSDWFFCEVKGVRASGMKDTLSEKQGKKFKEIAEKSGKPVRALHFKWAPSRP